MKASEHFLPLSAFLFPFALLLLSSCSITGYEDAFKVSEEEVEDLVAASKYSRHLMRREPPTDESPQTGTIELSLLGCIRTALENNRKYLTELENVFMQKIDTEVEQHNYFPLLDPLTMSYTSKWNNNGTKLQTDTYSSSAGISQKIPWGGSVAVRSTLTHTEDEAHPKTRQSLITPSVTLTLPLLKGSGLIVGMNLLVNAARAQKYAEREVENLKQVFMIEIVEKYFSILTRQREIVNYKTNLESATQLRKKSETQFKFGKVSKVDVFRAQYLETNAEKDLNLAQEALKLSIDAFKLDLGLPPEVEIVLKDEEIPYSEFSGDPAELVAAALKNNTLWKNTQDQYEDAKRTLVVAHDATKIQADITGSWTEDRRARDPTESFDRTNEEWQAGLTVSIPIDRKTIEAQYHRQVVAFVQFERNYKLSRDTLVRETRAQLIVVRQAQYRVTAQKAAVDQAQSAYKLLKFQYERGLVTNRDVIDAQQDLIRAQNGLLQALVDHKIAMLRLKQFCGTLEADDEGEWLLQNESTDEPKNE